MFSYTIAIYIKIAICANKRGLCFPNLTAT
jgi:hypothetical protein